MRRSASAEQTPGPASPPQSTVPGAGRGRLGWPRRHRRLVAGLTVLVLLGGGAAWYLQRDGSAAAAATTTTTTATASLTTMQKTVTASGTLTPTVQEDVSFAVSGTVTSVLVAAGDTVADGQALATVDTLQLNADLLEAKASLAQVEADLSDAEDDADGSDASDAKIAALTAQVAVAQTAVDDATAAMADATLVAPAAGLLTEVNIEVGDAVTGSGSSSSGGGTGAASSAVPGASSASSSSASTTSSAAFVIVGTDSYDVDVTVDDTDVALIAVGDQVEMTSDDITGTVYGTVSEIGLLSSSTGGVASYPVTVQVTGTPDGVRDGVAVDVSIVYERRTDVLTVPSRAVVTDGDTTYVLQPAATDGGDPVKTVVSVGETSGSSVEITAGLAEGDSVLVTVTTGGARGGAGTEGSTGTEQGLDPTQMGDFDPSQMGNVDPSQMGNFDPSQRGGPSNG